MLKILLGLVLLFQISGLSASQVGMRSVPHPFQDDLRAYDCHLSELAELEHFVEETKRTQAQLLQSAHPSAQLLTPETGIVQSLLGTSDPEGDWLMEVPGFLWGFCCSAAGMLFLYLLIEDPVVREREVYAAIRGCTVGTLLWVGVYVWFVYYATNY